MQLGSGLLLSVFVMITDDITHCCIMDTEKICKLLQGIAIVDKGIAGNVISFILYFS